MSQIINTHDNNLLIGLHPLRKWIFGSNSRRTICFFGFVDNFTSNDLITILLTLDFNGLIKFLSSKNGQFLIIVSDKQFTFCINDAAGTTQLIWSERDNKFFISDNLTSLKNLLNLEKIPINEKVAIGFAMSGYALADKTIHKCVHSLMPGHYLIKKNNTISVRPYCNWRPETVTNSEENYEENLGLLNEKIIKKLIKRADGRQIVVPLSAGYDSRLIASGLCQFQYDNVLCVSYGLKQNRETEIAAAVAARLNFRHIHINYTRKGVRDMWHSDSYQNFIDFCDVGTSVHFYGEFGMLNWLWENNEVDKNSIFSNGQSGDFISGNHIAACFHEKKTNVLNQNDRMELIENAIIAKHYGLWPSLVTEENKSLVRELLREQIDYIGGLPNNSVNDYGVFEALEFINRQSKYVLNGLRTYEYFGHDWHIPLWDREYMDFWKTVPLHLKENQKLYKKVLIKKNWGDVWLDFDLNPPARWPTHIWLMRHFLRSLFAVLGRKKWHDFERQKLDVYLSPTLSYAFKNNLEIWRDRRQHRHAGSYFTEHYLNRKFLGWDGKPNSQNKTEG